MVTTRKIFSADIVKPKYRQFVPSDMTTFKFILGIVCGLVAAGSALAQSQAIFGAGSSAAAPIYRSWAQKYQKATGITLNYEPIGSSAGIKKISSGETDFGASDVAPPAAELIKQGLTLFPIAITGISPVVNLPKIGDAQLHLTANVLAKIFLGEINNWGTAEIAQLNPGLGLPDMPIKVVVRSDGSGTTYNFADYLAKINPTCRSRYGVKTTLAWPTDFIGAKGSDGVVNAVKTTPGSIGYVDHGYVKENGLKTVQLMNASGEYLESSSSGFRAALKASEWTSKGVFNGTLTNMPGPGSWPITMGTFVLVPSVSNKAQQTQRALKFFVWAFMNGDTLVQENNFVRLPDRIQAAAFKSISAIKDKNGMPIGASLL
jgi:phosphate transport system substrate-binding protein